MIQQLRHLAINISTIDNAQPKPPLLLRIHLSQNHLIFSRFTPPTENSPLSESLDFFSEVYSSYSRTKLEYCTRTMMTTTMPNNVETAHRCTYLTLWFLDVYTSLSAFQLSFTNNLWFLELQQTRRFTTTPTNRWFLELQQTDCSTTPTNSASPL